MKYRLVIIWENGDKEIHNFNTKEKAERVGADYKKVFGGQVQWYGVSEV